MRIFLATDWVGMVRAFHERFGHLTSEVPNPDTPVGTRLLRARLIAEEAGEVIAAIHENDLVAIADGLADLIYVAVGAAVSYGIPIEKVFEEVHRSNMTKSTGAGHATGEKYANEGGKGPGYQPPDVRSILASCLEEPLGYYPLACGDVNGIRICLRGAGHEGDHQMGEIRWSGRQPDFPGRAPRDDTEI